LLEENLDYIELLLGGGVEGRLLGMKERWREEEKAEECGCGQNRAELHGEPRRDETCTL
jgi:hypothetical protein